MAGKYLPKDYVQFSKKLSASVAIFWGLYRLAGLVVAIIQPQLATALTTLTDGVDTVMLVNLGMYTGNSSIEKVALAWASTRKQPETTDAIVTYNEGDEIIDD